MIQINKQIIFISKVFVRYAIEALLFLIVKRLKGTRGITKHNSKLKKCQAICGQDVI